MLPPTRCGLCDVDYDFVGKTETLSRDFYHVVSENGLQSAFSRSDAKVIKNPTKKEENRTSKYISQLSEELLEGLLELYRNDFLLFEYDIEEYMPPK